MPFQIEKQREDLWCWAAVSASVDHYFFPASTFTQCKVAGKVLNRANCCADPDLCNDKATLQDALDAVGRLRDTRIGPLSFEDIRREIDAFLPIGVRIGWRGGGGHFVVISGYSESPSGAQLVDVADPLFPNSTMYYDDFVSAYQTGVTSGGEWTATFLLEP
jgi:papain like cysteine protease AvrRpt2